MTVRSFGLLLGDALEAICDAPTPVALAQALCAHAAGLSRLQCAVAERSGDTWVELYSSSPTGTHRPSTLPPPSRGREVDEEPHETTVLRIPSDGPENALLVDGVPAADRMEALRLLVDATGAALEAQYADLQLRVQRNAVAAVSENLAQLDDFDRSSDAGPAAVGPVHVDGGPSSMGAEFAASAASLTAREREVLQAITEGASNRAIAADLDVSIDTVKTHVKRILRKMGATNRTELIARSRSMG